MSRRPVVALALICVASSIRAADSPSIPSHPRQLRYPPQSIGLPSVDGRRVELAGGAVAFLAPDSTLPLVEVTLALRVGNFLDPEDQAGLAFVAGTQLRRGGAGRLDADAFDDRVDDLGARLETVVGTTRSGASLSVPSWELEAGLDLLFAMLSEPGYQADRLAVAHSNMLESMSRRNENALEILDREWSWLMYGHQHFSIRPITPASLGRLTRSELVEFHQRYWRADRMILAISGDFDRHTLLASLDRRLQEWAESESLDPAIDWPPPAPPAGPSGGLYHYESNVPQAKVMIGHRLPELVEWRSPDRFKLAVVAELLGGRGAISRIAGRLRTAEGLVYRASAHVDPGDLWPGELQIFFDTRNSSVARAVELVQQEVGRLRSETVHPRELEIVRQSLLARHRLRFDTAEEIAGYFAEDELLDRPHDYWQAYIDGVTRVTIADVQQTAMTFLRPSSFSYLIVGRWDEVSSGAPAGTSSLEKITGHRVIQLPARDPLTLEIESPQEKGAETDVDRSHGGFSRQSADDRSGCAALQPREGPARLARR